MIVFAELSSWMWILILAIALIPIISGSKYRCGHTKKASTFPFFAVLFILGIISVCFFFGMRSTVRHSAHRDYAEHEVVAAQFAANAELSKAVSHSQDSSLNALWDQITKSKIELDETDVVPDAKDKLAKKAVSESFGLTANGDLPPAWVINPPKWVGQVYRESVASDPFVTEEECRRQLEREQLPQAVGRRLEHLLEAEVGKPVKILNPIHLGIGLDYIFREICRDEFTATVDLSVGEMKKIHVLLEFDKGIDDHLVDTWLRNERDQRLFAFSKIMGLSLCGLAAAYSLLRFDTWSKGYYSKQLLVGGVLAIIALAVVLLRS